jgi:hypothetical protein
MALSTPVPREHLHTRSVSYKGYKRDDGLWDIEGHLTDTKTYPIDNSWRNKIDVGEPLHEMLIRVTVDEIQPGWLGRLEFAETLYNISCIMRHKFNARFQDNNDGN